MLSRRNLLGSLASTVALQPISASANMTCSAPNQVGLQECTAGLILGTVETVRQRCEQWCWAACIQAVLALHGRQVDQEYAVEKLFGTLTCKPATPDQIVEVINGPWIDKSGLFYTKAERLPDTSIVNLDSLSRSKCASASSTKSKRDCETQILGDWLQGHFDGAALIVDELKKGNPLIVGALGHATVLTAAKFSRSSTDKNPLIVLQELTIRDPWQTRENRRTLTSKEVADAFFVAKVWVG